MASAVMVAVGVRTFPDAAGVAQPVARTQRRGALAW